MKRNSLKEFFKEWDAGNFDFTDALGGNEHPSRPEAEQPLPAWDRSPIRRLRRREIAMFEKLYQPLAAILCTVMIGFLLYAVSFLPPFGAENTPTNNEVAARYLASGIMETGAVNAVAGVILDYRAFDTLGESHVLFTAMLGVLALLLSEFGIRETEAERRIMQDDLILRTTAKVVTPVTLIFGVYVMFNGHLGPGGGFSGGAIVGAGLILYSIAFGFEALGRILSFKTFRIVILCALGFYSLAKCYSFYCGANGFETIFSPGTPGSIFSAGLILPLNLAVGVVVSLTMYGFYSLFQRGKI